MERGWKLPFRMGYMPEKSTKIRILVADDHPVFRYGLRALLESEPKFTVVGEAADGSEVAKLTSALKPDVLMLDLAMPGLRNGSAAGVGVHPRPSTDHRSDRGHRKEQLVEALQLGARGILLKDAAIQTATKCIEKVITGEYWVGHEVVTSLVDYVHTLKRGAEGNQRRNCWNSHRENAKLFL
jgi:DNA-binding NarL/FixJ family response regulator